MSCKVATPLREVVVVGQGRLGGTVTRQLRDAGVTVYAIGPGDPIPSGHVTWLTVPDAVIAQVAQQCKEAQVLLHATQQRVH